MVQVDKFSDSDERYLKVDPGTKKSMVAGSVLSGIANIISPDTAIAKNSKFSSHRALCHRTVADAITKRNNEEDIIVLLGDDLRSVTHSILVDRSENVIADSFTTMMRYSPTSYRGRYTPSETIPIVAKMSVGEFRKRYLEESP